LINGKQIVLQGEKMELQKVHEPNISVIIPVRDSEPAPQVLQSLINIDYPLGKIEILIAEGKCPSMQRNRAAGVASGEILYFLDDDSMADIDLFRFAARSFWDPTVALVGGPSEIVTNGSLLQRSIGYVLGSYFATANVRCRYRAIGRFEQDGTEQNLILCNLAVRRQVFLGENGLDERLYPNEENEFLNRLCRHGHRAIYNPKMVVSRPHRSSLKEFFTQMYRYGRGRVEHFFIQPRFINPIYFLPLAFLFYLISLPFALNTWGNTLLSWIYLIPIGIYAEGVAVTSLRILAEEYDWPAMLLVPWLFPIVHVSYGIGIISGLLRRIVPSFGVSDDSETPQNHDIRVWLKKPLGTDLFLDKPTLLEIKESGKPIIEEKSQAVMTS